MRESTIFPHSLPASAANHPSFGTLRSCRPRDDSLLEIDVHLHPPRHQRHGQPGRASAVRVVQIDQLRFSELRNVAREVAAGNRHLVLVELCLEKIDVHRIRSLREPLAEHQQESAPLGSGVAPES